MKLLRVTLASGLVGLLGLGLLPARAAEVKSRNLELLGSVRYTGGTELAAWGDYVYGGELNGDTKRDEDPKKGGLHVFDVSRGAPREVGFFSCPGNDNDVELIRPGLVAMAHHKAGCNPPGEGEASAGFVLVDVREASDPTMIGSINLPSGSQAHTIKPYPGTDYVYVNPGGLPTNGRTTTHIVDVSNPRKPEIAATYTPTTTGSSTGCHDFSFHISRKSELGFCGGAGGFGIWDVSDPLKPTVISTIRNPQIQFNHFAVASSDGKLLALDDEAFALHTCKGTPSPTGRAWIYDISNPAEPKLRSSIMPPRGGDAVGIGNYVGWTPSWCLSHGLDWQPGTHNLAVTWFTGGVSVHSLHDPTRPKEVAYFMADNSTTYSVLWHKGRLYTNDMARGLDAFDFRR